MDWGLGFWDWGLGFGDWGWGWGLGWGLGNFFFMNYLFFFRSPLFSPFF